MSITGTKTRIGTLLHALLAVAAIVLLPIGLWLAYDAGRSINADLTLADRAQEGQRAAGTVLSTLVDAETGQRGYLLTDNPAYLEPFNTARGRLDADLARLDGMLATFPEWAAPVGRIRSLAAEKLAELQRTIALHQSGQANAARDVVRGDEGRHLMVAARAETGWLEADASDRMRQALGREGNARRLVTPLGLVAGGAALLGFLAFAQRRACRASEANLAGRIHLDEALGLLPGLLRHLDGRIIAWGRGAERLYGFTAAEAVGQVSHTLLRTEFPQPRDELDAALARDGQWNGELVHRHRDGPKRIVASHWALRPAEKRGLSFVIEINNDITALRQADAAMRESEERLRTATETAGIGLVLLNREHRYRFANKAYAEILDLPSHDLAGQRLADVLPSLYDEIRQRLDRAFAGERIVYELTRPAAPGHPDGRHYTVTYQLSRTVADEPVVVIVIVEITRRVLAMRALEDSQRILKLAMEASDLGIWRCETAQGGNTLDWDARCKAIFGFPADRPVTFEDWKQAVPDDQWNSVEAELNRSMSPDDPHDDYACTHTARRRDGAMRWIAAVGRTFFEPDAAAPSGRRAMRIIGTMRDVTQARWDEQQRQRNDELLRTILAIAPGLIYAKDWAGRYLVANGSVLALYGKSWAEMQGRTDRQICDGSAESEALMQNDRRVMAAGAAEAVEELFGEADDGQSRVWLSTKTPLRGSDGRVVGVVGVSLEITERKRFENRLQQMVHELNHRVKNTLATIQAIAGQSLRQADPLLRQKLEDRLLALAAAHDVLTREGWTGAGITEIVEAALAPVGGLDSGRIRIAGPKLRLLPRAALALSMGLHELARNAVTHGALSREAGEAGRVTVDWIIEGARLRLTWTEQGGPPVLSPKARGFGSRLVERSVARDLDGTAAIHFNPDGVSCVIEAPLDGIAASAQVLHLPNVGGRNER